MSKYDFEVQEFEDRQQRVRKAMEKAGIDLLIVTHPVNINYLIGSRVKGYQEFQALLFTLEPSANTFLTRFADVQEVADLSLSKDVRGWGRYPEDPIDVLKGILQEKGYLNRRIGLEVPSTYLSVHNYLKIKDLLGDALVAEPTDLIEELKLAKSPAEIAYIRKASSINDAVQETCIKSIADGVCRDHGPFVSGDTYLLFALEGLDGVGESVPVHFRQNRLDPDLLTYGSGCQVSQPVNGVPNSGVPLGEKSLRGLDAGVFHQI